MSELDATAVKAAKAVLSRAASIDFRIHKICEIVRLLRPENLEHIEAVATTVNNEVTLEVTPDQWETPWQADPALWGDNPFRRREMMEFDATREAKRIDETIWKCVNAIDELPPEKSRRIGPVVIRVEWGLTFRILPSAWGDEADSRGFAWKKQTEWPEPVTADC